MTFLDKLEKRFGKLAIENLSLWLVVGQIAVFGLSIFQFPVESILFAPDMVAQGQVWRVFTFLLQPPATAISPLFLIFYWYLFWMFGSTLEKHWGEFRFNVFILIGLLCTIVAGFVNWLILPADLQPLYVVTNTYLMTSVTFAFAILFPNFELLVFFVLPVKIKWLALFALALWVFTAGGNLLLWLLILAALVNVAIFFGPAFVRGAKAKQRRDKYHSERKAEQSTAFHTCVVCGKTDNDDPDMEFAYKDGKGYCRDHWDQMDKP